MTWCFVQPASLVWPKSSSSVSSDHKTHTKYWSSFSELSWAYLSLARSLINDTLRVLNKVNISPQLNVTTHCRCILKCAQYPQIPEWLLPLTWIILSSVLIPISHNNLSTCQKAIRCEVWPCRCCFCCELLWTCFVANWAESRWYFYWIQIYMFRGVRGWGTEGGMNGTNQTPSV